MDQYFLFLLLNSLMSKVMWLPGISILTSSSIVFGAIDDWYFISWFKPKLSIFLLINFVDIIGLISELKIKKSLLRW